MKDQVKAKPLKQKAIKKEDRLVENQVYALIPARSGSQRVPGKNVRPLLGLPLLAYSILTSEKCPSISVAYLSSDAPSYLELGAAYGGVPVQRPPNIAVASSTDFSVISHFVFWLQANSSQDVSGRDLIVYLRPTTPFRVPEVLEASILFMRENGEYSGLRSVELMGESAYKCFEMYADHLIPHVGARWNDMANQECPATYRPNGYVDVCRVDEILHNRLWGDRVKGWLTPRAVEIDTEEDFEYAEWLAKKMTEKGGKK